MNHNVICGETPFKPEDVGYDGERLKVLDEHFKTMMDKKEIISGSYCLSKDNKVFVDNALGKFSYEEEDERPFTPDTIFSIASITKVFTAVAILKLVEDGKIRLDQPVAEIIEEFNVPPYKDVMIVHLRP